MMKPLLRHGALWTGLLASVSPIALGHRAWLLPSATVLSGDDKWVTVDAAISNDLFYFEHFPMRLDSGVTVIAPDGTQSKVENLNTGRYRSTFDVALKQKGTYKIAVVSNVVMARWEENGEAKSFRGSAEKMAESVPKGAKNLQVSRMSNRNEIFVTSNQPNRTVLQSTGTGLELVPVTHPNDLVVGEKAKFQFLLNGKPAPDLEVTLIPGGIRYRDNLREIKVVTDKAGQFTVQFPDPGMYWMNAVVVLPAQPGSPAPVAAPAGRPGGGRGGMGNRASYSATLEVLPQ